MFVLRDLVTFVVAIVQFLNPVLYPITEVDQFTLPCQKHDEPLPFSLTGYWHYFPSVPPSFVLHLADEFFVQPFLIVPFILISSVFLKTLLSLPVYGMDKWMSMDTICGWQLICYLKASHLLFIPHFLPVHQLHTTHNSHHDPFSSLLNPISFWPMHHVSRLLGIADHNQLLSTAPIYSPFQRQWRSLPTICFSTFF